MQYVIHKGNGKEFDRLVDPGTTNGHWEEASGLFSGREW
jgi:hypothetical protein